MKRLPIACGKKVAEGDLYRQAEEMYQAQKFEEAVFTFDQMLTNYPEGELAPKAAFMMGYIYANELDQLDKAREYYNHFLERYSESADTNLINSANWELANLGKSVEEIEMLIPPTTTSTE